MANDFEGVDRFDDDFAPSKGFANKLEDIPDGQVYEFLILKAFGKKTEAGKNLLILKLRVLGGDHDGVEGEKVVFLTSKEAVNIFGGELIKLGFDADKWNSANGRKFSAELAAATGKLPGITFKGKKTTAKFEGGKTIINVSIYEKTGTRPVPQEGVAAGSEADPF